MDKDLVEMAADRGGKTVEIEGEMCILLRFVDENLEETEDLAMAEYIMYQKVEDVRPQGELQTYRSVRIVRGSAKGMLAN